MRGTKLTIIAALALVGGCSAGGDGALLTSCLDTYGYSYDVVGETGLTLKATVPQYTYITFEEMEAEYKDVEACAANTNTPGPTVVFGSFKEHNFSPLRYALYYYAQMTAYIDTDIDDRPQRNCISDRDFLRHEYMHHILYLNGEDASHNNRKFETCDALGPKTCNGEYCE